MCCDGKLGSHKACLILEVQLTPNRSRNLLFCHILKVTTGWDQALQTNHMGRKMHRWPWILLYSSHWSTCCRHSHQLANSAWRYNSPSWMLLCHELALCNPSLGSSAFSQTLSVFESLLPVWHAGNQMYMYHCWTCLLSFFHGYSSLRKHQSIGGTDQKL